MIFPTPKKHSEPLAPFELQQRTQALIVPKPFSDDFVHTTLPTLSGIY